MFLKKHEKGSALVIAIFIIVVMTLLGVALVRMISTSAESIAYEVLGTRAFNAAQVGLQWQLQQVFPLNESVIQDCPTITPPDINNIIGLENCSIVSAECSHTDLEGKRYYMIISTGECEVAGVLTSRKLEVQARSL